jgi:ferredoxin
LEIIINTELCQGYGQCALTAPEIFEVDPDGKSRLVYTAADAAERPEVQEAAEVCPMHAIHLVSRTM